MQEHSSEDEDEWGGIIGLQAEDREQVEHNLQTEASEVCPENGVAGVEDLNDDGNVGHPVDRQEEDMGAQEKDIDTQSTERVHQSPESACSGQEDADQSPVREKKYPLRLRKPKLMFTYHWLGLPTMSHE